MENWEETWEQPPHTPAQPSANDPASVQSGLGAADTRAVSDAKFQ